ncbi:hypothetical protein BD779DRAFT_1590485 [Infundibulicybe gibba]|nr:hypothetical protein BD779DRAFT_1590485 [Infundibulicybe gibba]
MLPNDRSSLHSYAPQSPPFITTLSQFFTFLPSSHIRRARPRVYQQPRHHPHPLYCRPRPACGREEHRGRQSRAAPGTPRRVHIHPRCPCAAHPRNGPAGTRALLRRVACVHGCVCLSTFLAWAEAMGMRETCSVVRQVDNNEGLMILTAIMLKMNRRWPGG